MTTAAPSTNPVQRGFRWAVLVLAILVAVGVFLQVYFIASYFFGAGEGPRPCTAGAAARACSSRWC